MHEAASENERLAKLENGSLKELLFQAGSEIHLKGGHTSLSIEECGEVCCQKIAKVTAELKGQPVAVCGGCKAPGGAHHCYGDSCLCKECT